MSVQRRRWEGLFGREPWFDVICHLVEVSDLEGADDALDRMLFKMNGSLATRQRCPRCGKIRHQWRSFGVTGACDVCEQQAEWERLADALLECERAREWKRIWALLTPDERERYEAWHRSEWRADHIITMVYLGGLTTRDVQ